MNRHALADAIALATPHAIADGTAWKMAALESRGQRVEGRGQRVEVNTWWLSKRQTLLSPRASKQRLTIGGKP